MRPDRATDDALQLSAAETAERLRRRPRPGFTAIRGEPEVSFEFFPPSTAEMERTLWSSLERLAPLGPNFVSVTYGALGSTRERTYATVSRILEETTLNPAAHLTCVGATRDEVDRVVARYREAGIRHLVLLRGDPPDRAGRFAPHPDGYRCAAELVESVARHGDVEISVAAYPEVHPDARSRDADLDNLKRKVDAGASRAITQFFFDPDVYFRFLDRARAAGISVPIVPGILPITNFAKLRRFATACGASIPAPLAQLFEGLDDVPDVRQLVAVTVAAELCTRLREQGMNAFHFYTLNRASLSAAVCHILGMRAQPGADAARRRSRRGAGRP